MNHHHGDLSKVSGERLWRLKNSLAGRKKAF